MAALSSEAVVVLGAAVFWGQFQVQRQPSRGSRPVKLYLAVRVSE